MRSYQHRRCRLTAADHRGVDLDGRIVAEIAGEVLKELGVTVDADDPPQGGSAPLLEQENRVPDGSTDIDDHHRPAGAVSRIVDRIDERHVVGGVLPGEDWI